MHISQVVNWETYAHLSVASGRDQVGIHQGVNGELERLRIGCARPMVYGFDRE